MDEAPRVRELQTQEWSLLRELRLRALRDAPDAFSKTWAEEASYPEAEWRRRIARAPGDPALLWAAAEIGGKAVGLVCGRMDPRRAQIANLFSLWVEPTARRGGVGRLLVEAIVRWAHAENARQLLLGVAPSNQRAVGLYRSCGFVASDLVEPAGTAVAGREPPLMMQFDL